MMQKFFAGPIKVMSVYMGHKVIVFENTVTIKVNKELKGQKEANHL